VRETSQQTARVETEGMTLRGLKWLGIVAPLAFLSILWMLLHTIVGVLHDFPGYLILLVLMAASIALFSFGVFRLIDRLERRLVEQNRQLEQRNRELETLLAVGRAASSSLQLADVLDEGLESILEVTTAKAAEVWLSEGGELRLARQSGAEPAAFAERTTLRLGEGLPGIAAETGSPVVSRDLPADGRFVRRRVKEAGFTAFSALPMSQQDEIVGVLGVAARDDTAFSSAEELRLLEGIAERLGAAIANARLHTRVLDAALIDERVLLARELHDGLAQVLGYLNTQTLALGTLLDTGRISAARDELEAMREVTLREYADVRESILGLHVPGRDHVGLRSALERYVSAFSSMAGIGADLDGDAYADGRPLPPAAEIQLVRIVQEALSNVRKHAKATTATVRLTSAADTLRLEIEDDGRGFDPARVDGNGWPRFGMQTMRERAKAMGASFAITTTPGRGTTVSVELPLDRTPVPQEEATHARAAR
jgi:nitrate/nitrite-specific signal transduction histidine kinase